MVRLNTADWLALVFTIVGALNWGLVGLFGVNVVNAIFGTVPFLESLIYAIVGLAGLWLVYLLARAGAEQPVPPRA